MAHLTHVSEMQKKCETLARITTILKDVIQNKVSCFLWVFHLMFFFTICKCRGSFISSCFVSHEFEPNCSTGLHCIVVDLKEISVALSSVFVMESFTSLFSLQRIVTHVLWGGCGEGAAFFIFV